MPSQMSSSIDLDSSFSLFKIGNNPSPRWCVNRYTFSKRQFIPSYFLEKRFETLISFKVMK